MENLHLWRWRQNLRTKKASSDQSNITSKLALLGTRDQNRWPLDVTSNMNSSPIPWSAGKLGLCNAVIELKQAVYWEQGRRWNTTRITVFWKKSVPRQQAAWETEDGPTVCRTAFQTLKEEYISTESKSPDRQEILWHTQEVEQKYMETSYKKSWKCSYKL